MTDLGPIGNSGRAGADARRLEIGGGSYNPVPRLPYIIIYRKVSRVLDGYSLCSQMYCTNQFIAHILAPGISTQPIA